MEKQEKDILFLMALASAWCRSSKWISIFSTTAGSFAHNSCFSNYDSNIFPVQT